MKNENLENSIRCGIQKKTPIDIVCRYDGTTYALKEGKKKKLSLKDYEMPFVSRHQKNTNS